LREQIRATDGLLQRYIKKMHPSVNNFRWYWSEGNKDIFVDLVRQVEDAEACREVILDNAGQQQDDEDNVSDDDSRSANNKNVQEAEKYLQPALDYFDTFATISSDLWEIIAAPYRKVTQKDLSDFIAPDDQVADNSDDSGGGGGGGQEDMLAEHRAKEMEAWRESMADVEEEAERYKRTYMRSISGEGSARETNEYESDDEVEVWEKANDDDDDDVHVYATQPEEEEMDDWEEKILSKRKAPQSKSSLRNSSSQSRRTRRRARNNIKRRLSSGSDHSLLSSQRRTAGDGSAGGKDDGDGVSIFDSKPCSVRRRLVIEESDSE